MTVSCRFRYAQPNRALSQTWAVDVQASRSRPALHTRRACVLHGVCVAQTSSPQRQSCSLFVFGLGYVGRAVANQAQKLGWNVTGTCRSYSQQVVKPILFNAESDLAVSSVQVLEHLRQSTHVLSTMPPCQEETVALNLLRTHATDHPSCLKWVGYLSSTSVYGDWGGAWVNESSEIRPASQKAIQRAQSEAKWLTLHHTLGLPVHCFRLGGIYGPGRSALDAVQKQGLESSSQKRRSLQQYTARCHVHDIAKVLLASMQQPVPGSIYNVVDDVPASRAEALAFASSLLLQHTGQNVQHSVAYDAQNSVQPETGASNRNRAQLNSHASKFSSMATGSINMQGASGDKRGEKRVSNQKLKAELGVSLDFPSYREGLAAIHAGCMQPFD